MIASANFPGLLPGRGRRAASVLALALLACGAAAAATPLAWDARGTAQRVLTVEPGQMQSLCTPLRSAQQVVWAFVAQAPLDFDLQLGNGARLQPPARRQAVMEARDLLVAGRNQEHCWMWHNRGERPVQVALQLRRR